MTTLLWFVSIYRRSRARRSRGVTSAQRQRLQRARSTALTDGQQLQLLLRSSIASSTFQKYSALWERWRKYAIDHNYPILPAKSVHIALFLANISLPGQKSICEAARASIKWFHAINNMPSACDTPVILTAAAGVKKLYAKAPVRKQHFTISLLKKLCCGLDENNFLNIQFLAYACIAFFGFFRYSDLARVA